MRTKIAIAGAVCLFAAGPVAADNGYLGVGVANWTYDEEGFETADATGLQLAIGNGVTEHVTIETRFVTGGSDSVPVFVQGFGTVEVTGELDHAFSFLVKPHTGGERVRGYGLVGFSQLEMTFSAGDVSETESDSGLSYGAGVEAQLGDGVWLSGEYVHYMDEDIYDFTATTVGLRFDF